MNPSLKYLLVVVAFLVLAAPAVAAPRTEAPDMACVHGGTGGIGHSPFHCWCLEWAHTNTTRFRICRVIAWSDGRETALPPHEYAPRLGAADGTGRTGKAPTTVGKRSRLELARSVSGGEYAPRSLRPDPAPQCRRKRSCHVHYVKPRPWSYWTIVDVWDDAGNHTTVPALCRVRPKHETLCQIAVPL